MAILVGRRAARFMHFMHRPCAQSQQRCFLKIRGRLWVSLRSSAGMHSAGHDPTRPNSKTCCPNPAERKHTWRCRLRCATTTALGVPSPALHPAQRSKRVQAWNPEVPRCPCLQALSICSGTTLQIRSCTDATRPLPASVGACIDRALPSPCPSEAMGKDTAVS